LEKDWLEDCLGQGDYCNGLGEWIDKKFKETLKSGTERVKCLEE
jgi:hypothetical protein